MYTCFVFVMTYLMFDEIEVNIVLPMAEFLFFNNNIIIGTIRETSQTTFRNKHGIKDVREKTFGNKY